MKQRRQHVGLSILDAEGLHCFRTFMVMIARDTENPAEDAFKPDAGKHRFPSRRCGVAYNLLGMNSLIR